MYTWDMFAKYCRHWLMIGEECFATCDSKEMRLAGARNVWLWMPPPIVARSLSRFDRRPASTAQFSRDNNIYIYMVSTDIQRQSTTYKKNTETALLRSRNLIRCSRRVYSESAHGASQTVKKSPFTFLIWERQKHTEFDAETHWNKPSFCSTGAKYCKPVLYRLHR